MEKTFYAQVLRKEGDKYRVLWMNTGLKYGNIVTLETLDSAIETWKYLSLRHLENSIETI